MSGTGWDDMALVGQVARAHGNRGHVIVNPETDFPDERFAAGRRVFTRQADGTVRALEIVAVRFHQGRPILTLDGVSTMNDAEALAGAELRVPESELRSLPAGAFYHHDLVGCEVVLRDGTRVGRVRAVEGPTQRSTLVVESPRGDVLVPLAAEICVAIDPQARRIVLEPPEGLLDANEKGGWRDRPARR